MRRAALITLLLAVGLVAGTRYLLSTAWLLEQIRTQAQTTVPGLRIDRIEGDAWRQLRFIGLAYTDSVTKVTMDTIQVRYSLWPLIRRTVDLDHAFIHGMNAAIRTRPDTAEDTAATRWPDWTVNLRHLRLTGTDVSVDGIPYVNGLALAGSASLRNGMPAIAIDTLSFVAGGLPVDAVSVSMNGGYSGSRIRLDQLAIATGRSMLRSSGQASLSDTSFSITASASPLSWRDVIALAEDVPLRQDLALRLAASGSYERFRLTIQAEAAGMRELEIDLNGSMRPTATVQDIRIRSEDLDLSRLLREPELPSIGSVLATLSGEVPIRTAVPVHLHGSIAADRIRVGTQSIRRMESTVTLAAESAEAVGRIRIAGSPIRFAIASKGWGRQAAFRLTAETDGFDLRDIDGFSDLPSSLNATVQAEGRLDRFKASLFLRNSTLNRAPVQELTAIASVDGDILTLSEARIRSAIIDGQLTARYNQADATDTENRLDADIRILDLQPLAAFIGVDTLRASGTFRARLNRGPDRALRLNSDLRITATQVDELKTGPITGEVVMDWLPNPIVDLRLRIADIAHADTIANSTDLRLMATLHPDSTVARYRLDTDFERPLAIRHDGVAVWKEERLDIRGERLDIFLDEEPYRLEQPFHAVYTRNRWTLADFGLLGGSGVRARLEAAFDGTSITATGDIENADLGHVSLLMAHDIPVSGRASIRFDAEIHDGQPRFESRVRLRNLLFYDMDADSLTFHAALADHRLTLSGSAYRKADLWLDFIGSVPFRFEHPETIDDTFFDEAVTGRFRMNATSLDDWPAFTSRFGMTPLAGRLTAIATLDGTAGMPEFDGRLDLVRGALAGVPIDSLGFSWTYSADSRHLAVASEWRSLNQTAMRMSGDIPFSVDMRTFTAQDMSDQPLRVLLNTRAFNLEAMNAFIDPGVARRISGQLNGDITVTGTLDQPRLDGSLILGAGSVYMPGQNITVRDISLETRFTPGRIELTHLRAQSNGRLNASGWVSMNGLIPDRLDFTVTGQNLRVSDTRNVQLFTSIDARLAGSLDAAKATGTIRLERGHLYLEEFGETPVETVLLEEDQPSPMDDLNLYRNLTMEMRIRTEQNVWVRNRSAPELQVELTGDLDLVKEPGGELMVFGTMGTRQGHVTQLGKRFILEKGEVVFSGDAGNPALDVRTAYVLRPPNDITVWYSIGGTLNTPSFAYESSPEMELEDMFSYTLFNRPFNALMSWEQSMTSQGSLGNLAVDLLADRVGDLAAGALGLDVIEIDNSRSSGNSGMTVKAGKYVNDRLFLAILQEFGGTTDSQVIMEYALRQNLNVVLTGSDRRKSGIDIQWKYDY